MKQTFTLLLLLVSWVALTAQKLTTVPGVFNDAVYVSGRDALYATRSSSDPQGNTLVRIDPETGEVLESYFVGNDPQTVVATTSGDYLYIGFRGENQVRRFNLTTKSVDQEFSPGGYNDFLGPFYAEDILPLRGSDDVVAVSSMNSCCSPRHEGVAVYNSGKLRPSMTAGHTGSNSIAYTDRDDVIIGYNNETTDFQLRRMQVTDTGLVVTNEYSGIDGFGVRIEYQDGKLYATNGQVVRLSDGVPSLAGTADLSGLATYGGQAVEAVPTAGLIYYLGWDEEQNFVLRSVNLTTLTRVDQYTLSRGNYDYYNSGARTLLSLGSDEDFAYVTSSGTLGLISLCTSSITQVPPAYTGLTYLCGQTPLQLIVPAGAREAGQEILWSNGRVGDTISVTETGPYSYRVQDGTGCPGPASPEFYVNQTYYYDVAPYLAMPATTVLCEGGSLPLTVEYYYGNTLYWSNGEQQQTIYVTEPGTYYAYSVDQESGCVSMPSESITITASDAVAPPAPIIDQGNYIDTCSNQPINLTVKEPALEYFWRIGEGYLQRAEGNILTFYPYYQSIPFSLVVKDYNQCLSAPAIGAVTFHEAPATPYLQFNASNGTLAASVDGPLLWYFQGELEGESTGRFYRPRRNGFYTARAQGNNCLSEESNLISVEGITTATHDEVASRQVTIFPNPVRDRIFVTIAPELARQLPKQEVNYQLHTMNGAVAASGTFTPLDANAPIYVEGLASGMYLLTFFLQEHGIVSKRVVVL